MMRVLYLAVCATALQAPTQRRHRRVDGTRPPVPSMRGSRTRLRVAPSGVDGLPVPLQAVVFLGCAGGIGGGAVACNAAIDKIRGAFQATGAGAEAWRKFVE